VGVQDELCGASCVSEGMEPDRFLVRILISVVLREGFPAQSTPPVPETWVNYSIDSTVVLSLPRPTLLNAGNRHKGYMDEHFMPIAYLWGERGRNSCTPIEALFVFIGYP
jgi:hypothetical protein